VARPGSRSHPRRQQQMVRRRRQRHKAVPALQRDPLAQCQSRLARTRIRQLSAGPRPDGTCRRLLPAARFRHRPGEGRLRGSEHRRRGALPGSPLEPVPSSVRLDAGPPRRLRLLRQSRHAAVVLRIWRELHPRHPAVRPLPHLRHRQPAGRPPPVAGRRRPGAGWRHPSVFSSGAILAGGASCVSVASPFLCAWSDSSSAPSPTASSTTDCSCRWSHPISRGAMPCCRCVTPPPSATPCC
jgi:hypothetical protein